MTRFEFTYSRIDGVLVAAPVGEIDHTTALELRTALAAHLDDLPAAMIIRLDRVTFLDTAALASWSKLTGWPSTRRIVALAASSAPVRKLFAITHLDQIIPTHATVRTARTEARAHSNTTS